MGDHGELQLQFGEDEEESMKMSTRKQTSSMNLIQQQKPRRSPKTKETYRRWLRIGVYTLLLLAGQSVGIMLGRLYFDKGGNSKWLATLVSLIGFPILLPLYMIKSLNTSPSNITLQSNPPTPTKLAFVYVSLGLLIALGCFLYSVGLMYLPVSTYSLICASQLAFNALFSYFLNSLLFTPFIVNSLVLLTISSTLLVFHTEPVSEGSDHHPVSRAKFITGFICTVAASAGYGLMLSLTQLAFKKVIKKESFKAIMDMIIYQSLVASSAIFIGLFASGEWRSLKREMDEFQLGKVAYLMTLLWTAISWQLFTIGCVGLIFDVSSLFSNAISVLGLPIVPVFAVIFFHDKMDGLKIVAMILAVWGFVSYGYQNYLDDFKDSFKVENRDSNEVSTESIHVQP
ncbi:purine permease 21-like [Benincasa hispida]|uniref:purine permease 21-like n=1 Tax=Benincasa hispida TaxID=102211 RepID=UPI001901A416|nr:purine permease 21-like [Benincasa hispida]